MIAEIMRKIIDKKDLTDDERNQLVAWFERAEQAPYQLETIFKGASRITNVAQITDGIMGIMVAGKFIALAPGVLTVIPTDAGFTGTFMSGSGETFSGSVYNIGGVAAGVLKWGASQTTGRLVFGGGDGWLDEFGLTFANQEGLIQFLDTLGGGTMVIYADGGNSLILENSFGGKGITFYVDTATHNVLDFNFMESLVAEVAELQISGVNGAVITLGSGVEIWASKDGMETVFNQDSFDIDHRWEGAADPNLLKLDGGTDRAGIGVASPGYKLDVNGDVNVATGSTFKVNGSTVISGTVTGVTNGDSHDHAGGDGAAITDANLSFTDVTTNNASTTKHGHLIKATAPASGVRNVVAIDNGETVYKNTALVDSVAPAGLATTAASGTSLLAARRDHVHSYNGGWTEVSDTWTYLTAAKFTIPSDGTTIYNTGMKIRWAQGGGYKYGVCLLLTATVLTIFDTPDYVVDNAAVTNIAYSFEANPYGFPNDFSFLPNIANLTSTSGTFEAFYNVQGRRVQGHLSFTFGASSAIGGSLTLTLPAGADTYTKNTPIGMARFKDATGGDAAGGVIFSSGIIAVYVASGTYLTGTALSSTVPFTWATNDDFEVDFDYFFA